MIINSPTNSFVLFLSVQTLLDQKLGRLWMLLKRSRLTKPVGCRTKYIMR